MLCITNCGYNSQHSRICDIEYKYGVEDYLILLLKTDAWMYLNGEKQKILSSVFHPVNICITDAIQQAIMTIGCILW